MSRHGGCTCRFSRDKSVFVCVIKVSPGQQWGQNKQTVPSEPQRKRAGSPTRARVDRKIIDLVAVDQSASRNLDSRFDYDACLRLVDFPILNGNGFVVSKNGQVRNELRKRERNQVYKHREVRKI